MRCLHSVREFLGGFLWIEGGAQRSPGAIHARNNSLTIRQADDSIPGALMSRVLQERDNYTVPAAAAAAAAKSLQSLEPTLGF